MVIGVIYIDTFVTRSECFHADLHKIQKLSIRGRDMVGCVLRLSIYYFGSYVINIDRLVIYSRHMFPTSKNSLILVITFAFHSFFYG